MSTGALCFLTGLLLALFAAGRLVSLLVQGRRHRDPDDVTDAEAIEAVACFVAIGLAVGVMSAPAVVWLAGG